MIDGEGTKALDMVKKIINRLQRELLEYRILPKTDDHQIQTELAHTTIRTMTAKAEILYEPTSTSQELKRLMNGKDHEQRETLIGCYRHTRHPTAYISILVS
jgi:hypothetical protein